MLSYFGLFLNTVVRRKGKEKVQMRHIKQKEKVQMRHIKRHNEF